MPIGVYDHEKIRNTEEDFWSKINIKSENECWNWTRSRVSGYGYWSWKGENILAHRLAWIFTYGEIPDGLDILHDPLCDKTCCNPNHLRLGTHAENMRDIDVAKLNWNQVREIRKLYATDNYTQSELAILFNVHRSNIGHITNNKSWIE